MSLFNQLLQLRLKLLFPHPHVLHPINDLLVVLLLQVRLLFLNHLHLLSQSGIIAGHPFHGALAVFIPLPKIVLASLLFLIFLLYRAFQLFLLRENLSHALLLSLSFFYLDLQFLRDLQIFRLEGVLVLLEHLYLLVQ